MALRRHFEQELVELEETLVKMGDAVEGAVVDAVDSIFSRDDGLADRVIEGDDAIDKWDFSVEKGCMRLLALQQPMARDLRAIGSMLKIVTDLERIGDNAVDIAKCAKRLNTLPPLKPYQHLPQLLEMVRGMIHDGLRAFATRDIDLMRAVCARDSDVDALYGLILTETYTLMEGNHELVRQGDYVVTTVRCLERIADHVTNIGERVVYIETGELENLNE